MDYSKNEIALLDLIKNINETFSFVGQDQDEPLICDGDIRLLDKAVKRFKTTVWENQLDQWHKVSSIPNKNGLLLYQLQKQTFFPIMKKVALKDVVQPTPNKGLKLSKILDYLTDLGWEYTCNSMTRSGMQTYDELMQYIGVLQPDEHWNEDAYNDKCGDW